MKTISDIEQAIEELPPDEFIRLRDWFFELDAQRWDRQFESDVTSGRLDPLGVEALDDARNGRVRDFDHLK